MIELLKFKKQKEALAPNIWRVRTPGRLRVSRDKSIDKALPRLAPLKAFANHITATRCPISPRTLERWPLRFRIINREKAG